MITDKEKQRLKRKYWKKNRFILFKNYLKKFYNKINFNFTVTKVDEYRLIPTFLLIMSIVFLGF